jgi:hypothetical protein
MPETTAHPRRLAASMIDSLLPYWAGQPTITLNLDEYASVDRIAAAVMTCALTGSLGDRPLQVVATKETRLDWLESSGLAFALAQRRGPTQLEAGPADGQWRRDWSPGFGSPWSGAELPRRDTLFEPEMIGETGIQPDLAGPSFAAFVNPHLTRRASGPHPVATVLWPWLTRLISVTRPDAHDDGIRARMVSDIGRLVDEVVTNVGDHATVDGPIASLVQVSVTRGGGQRSHNRLHIAVTDTGPGITTTARKRLGPEDRGLDDETLLGHLLDARLAPWGRGRGQGLPRVADLCRAYDAVLRVATRTTNAVLEPDEALQTRTTGYCLHGSVVTMTIPLAV